MAGRTLRRHTLTVAFTGSDPAELYEAPDPLKQPCLSVVFTQNRQRCVCGAGYSSSKVVKPEDEWGGTKIWLNTTQTRCPRANAGLHAAPNHHHYPPAPPRPRWRQRERRGWVLRCAGTAEPPRRES